MKEKKTAEIFTDHLKCIFERVNGSESICKNLCSLFFANERNPRLEQNLQTFCTWLVLVANTA